MENYRNNLAEKLKSSPKELRRKILSEEQKSAEYINYFYDHNKPRWQKREEIRIKQRKEIELDINFDLSDIEDLRIELNKLGEYIYSTITVYDREGGYDPQKGHMLCGEITDKFIEYLKDKGIESRRISRHYEIMDPSGRYNDSFGHVYLIIDTHDGHILVDPTYLQWLSEEERKNKPSVLVIQFKNQKDFESKFADVPIKAEMVLPFYLGFSSEETKRFFAGSKYTVVSEDVARLDD